MRKRKLVLQILLFSFIFLGGSFLILQNVFNDHSVVYAEGYLPGITIPNNNTEQNKQEQNQQKIDEVLKQKGISDLSGILPTIDQKKYPKEDLIAKYGYLKLMILDVDYIALDFSSIGSAVLNSFLPINLAVSRITDFIWYIYVAIAYFTIWIVSWAYNLEIIDILGESYDNLISQLNEAVLKPFLFFMFAMAVAWMVYYYATGKKQKFWNALINTLIILAFSTTFINLGSYIRFWTNVSSKSSIFVLKGLLSVSWQGQISQEDEKLKNLMAGAATDRNDWVAPTRVDSGQYDLSVQGTVTIHNLLFNTILLEPFKLAEFGSISFANGQAPENKKKQRWEELLDQDIFERLTYINKHYSNSFLQINFNNYGSIFTLAGAWTRFGNVILSTSFSMILIVCLLSFAARMLLWQCIAIGRSLVGAYHLLLSLWPEYGLKEAIQWYWSMIQALLMKLFYSVILGVYMLLVQMLLDLSGKYGFVTMCLLGWALYWGLNQAVKELREKVVEIPLGDGVYLTGDKGQADGVVSDAVQKTAGVALAGAGLAVGSAAVATAGVNLASGGAKGLVHGLVNSTIRGMEEEEEIRQQGQEQTPQLQPQTTNMQPTSGDQQGQSNGSGSTAQDSQNTRQRNEENQTQQFGNSQQVLQQYQQQQIADLTVDIQAKIDDLRNELKRLESEGWQFTAEWKALDSIQDKKLNIDVLLNEKAVEILEKEPGFRSITTLSGIYKKYVYPKYAPTAIRNEIPED